ncbi:hypothetical protein SY111_16450 [Ligilactobacillus agilis]|uniref:DUF806 domain-containing protein n=2 Tax=Ligilactobacillus agilis TaxID=1601 RepID=A0A6F9XUP7_9LACO|nr:hypothetical protein SY111_16450 [Ligilactobacillus agilis]
MTPAAYIYSIIANNILEVPNLSLDNVYTFYIDENASFDEVLMLITETVSMGDDYGNNEVLYSNRRIQIDLYYPKDYTEDMTLIERDLKKLLRKNGIYCYSDAGHILTLDSERITNTLKFNFKMEE